MWFIFVACLSKSQPTAAPNPEPVSSTEVQMKEEKKTKTLTVTRQIAPKVETTLIDGISIQFSQNHKHLVSGGAKGFINGHLKVGEESVSFGLELAPHAFQEFVVADRVIRLNATGFYEFPLQVEVLGKPLPMISSDEAKSIVAKLSLASTCGEVNGSMESNGVLRLQTKGGCEVYIGQYSHMVLHISTDAVGKGDTAE